MSDQVRYGTGLPNPFTPGVVVDFYGNPISGGGTGWPANAGSGSGSLQAATLSSDVVGYNLTDHGSGGIKIESLGTGSMTLESAVGLEIAVLTGYINLSGPVAMPQLPTSDPHTIGRLWNNSGVVTVSAG